MYSTYIVLFCLFRPVYASHDSTTTEAAVGVRLMTNSLPVSPQRTAFFCGDDLDDPTDADNIAGQAGVNQVGGELDVNGAWNAPGFGLVVRGQFL